MKSAALDQGCGVVSSVIGTLVRIQLPPTGTVKLVLSVPLLVDVNWRVMVPALANAGSTQAQVGQLISGAAMAG